MQGSSLDEEDIAMDLAAEGDLSLVVRYHGEVVAALLSTAVAAPTPGLTVMQLQLVAVQPDYSDAAEVHLGVSATREESDSIAMHMLQNVHLMISLSNAPGSCI